VVSWCQDAFYLTAAGALSNSVVLHAQWEYSLSCLRSRPGRWTCLAPLVLNRLSPWKLLAEWLWFPLASSGMLWGSCLW